MDAQKNAPAMNERVSWMNDWHSWSAFYYECEKARKILFFLLLKIFGQEGFILASTIKC